MFLSFVLKLSTSLLIHSSQASNMVEEYYGCPNSSYLCEALTQNMNRDNNRCRVSPRSIASLGYYMDQQNDPANLKKIDGRIRYFGPFTGNYNYSFTRKSKTSFIVDAAVHFKNLNSYSRSEINRYQEKFNKAARIWNQNSPHGKTFEFVFKIAARSSNRVVSPRLIRQNTRGPYFDKWSFNWSAETIAHEFGHIMGLFDEYSYEDSSNPNCDSRSIMCSSFRGTPQHYHYQLLLQRVYCEVGN